MCEDEWFCKKCWVMAILLNASNKDNKGMRMQGDAQFEKLFARF